VNAPTRFRAAARYDSRPGSVRPPWAPSGIAKTSRSPFSSYGTLVLYPVSYGRILDCTRCVNTPLLVDIVPARVGIGATKYRSHLFTCRAGQRSATVWTKNVAAANVVLDPKNCTNICPPGVYAIVPLVPFQTSK
jgi:hypothetical protein